MGRASSRTHAWYAKHTFYLAVALVVGGALLDGATPAVFGRVPDWVMTLGVEMEIVGILLGVLAVFGFGILLPLAE